MTPPPEAGGLIVRVDAIGVSIPLSGVEESATLKRVGFDNLLVRIETDGGAVGWGEISGGSGAPVAVLRPLVEMLKPMLIGRSVFEIDALRAVLIDAGRLANLRRLAHLVIAGFDIACWDAAGKLAGRPIHELMGGAVRDSVDYYGYPLAKDPQTVAAEARGMAEAGFSVIYLKAGLSDVRDVETVKQVRAAVGRSVRIRVDSNEAWDLATARRICTAIEAEDIDFVEQPLDARDLVGMRELRRSTAIPIAANQGIWSIAEAQQAIRLGACDVIVTGPFWLGGLLPLRHLGAVCAESGIGFCLHAPPATSIGTAAGLQVLATLPRLLDGNQTYLYYLAEDVSDDLGDPARARLPVPRGPGLGISVDEKRVTEMARRQERDGPYSQTARTAGAN